VREGGKHRPQFIDGEHVGVERNMGKAAEIKDMRASVINNKFSVEFLKDITLV
jgi:hypothetical protein